MLSMIRAPGWLPAGQRVYAVGDVHGCIGQLRRLHAAVARDLTERPIPTPRLVHLGDYVDRGEDSAGVIALLSAGSPVQGVPTVNLIGNHERMMLDALAGLDRMAVPHWLRNGGGAALRSWGLSPRATPTAWAKGVPQAHLDFMRGLSISLRLGGYVFVHAGVRPDIPFDRQTEEDLIWIREPFLSWEGALEAVVVHGHTPVAEPVVRANRIGIDTAAVMGGRLSCAVLEGDSLGFLSA